jgi:hypothetical protein
MVLKSVSPIRGLTPAHLPQVMRVQTAYAEVYSGAPVIPGEVYLSPGFEGGRNVFCGFDEAGRLLESVVGQAREIAASAPGHPSQLVFRYLPVETAGIACVLSKRCEHAGKKSSGWRAP